MKKYLIPIISIILVFCFSFSTFALSSYNYTLKDFLGLNGSSIYAYRRSKDGSSYGANYQWDNNYSLRMFTAGDDSPANTAYGFDVRSSYNGGDVSPILEFNPNDVIIFSAPRLQYEFTTTSTYIVDIAFQLVITFGFRDNYNDVFEVEMYNVRSRGVGIDNGTAAVPFDDVKFEYSVPLNYRSLEYMRFEVRTPYAFAATAAGSDVVFASTENVLFFAGGRADAPLYDGADTSVTDQFHDAEQGLLNDTQNGRDEALGILSDGYSAFQSQLGIMEGTLAVSSLFSNIISGIGLGPLLYLSLAFGMFAFIVGMSSLIISRANKGNSVKKKGG